MIGNLYIRKAISAIKDIMTPTNTKDISSIK